MNDFFVLFYDNLFANQDFSSDLYDKDFFSFIGTITILVSVGIMTLYYFLLSNYKDFYKITGWLTSLLIVAILTFGITWYFASDEINFIYRESENGHPYNVMDFVFLAFSLALYSIFFSFVASLFLKLKSTSASKTPF
ncbi:hypothetical protein ACSVH5_11770 [Flavobacterium sp. RSSA_27]|uniref:hypothetical protein n=1 Tax=Flavobacterium sp. RSSA_27 TaxID=3447667 RepID=UPI003F2FE518